MKILPHGTQKSRFSGSGISTALHRRAVFQLVSAVFVLLLLMILGGCAFSDTLEAYLHPADEELQDETQPIPTPLLTVSSPTPIPIVCQKTTGTVTRISIPSEELEDEFTASVYTPPCYDPVKGGYPVVYLLHGQTQDDTFWYSLGAAHIADNAINANRRPFLMVMPYEEDAFAPVSDSHFDEAVVEELIPYIESHYAVCTSRDCRAIGGISHGGGWAVHIALEHIDLFGSVGAHSIGYFAGDSYRINKLSTTLSADQFPRFYVDHGEQDYLREESDALDRVLTQNSIAHEYVVSPGVHAASYWKAHVAEYLDWYMDGWDPVPGRYN
jgi:enterochelin esterase-like enzyme